MIYIEYDKKQNNRITYINYFPFSDENGLNKTQDELLKTGALVDEIPYIECPFDKQIYRIYCNENNSVECFLEDRILDNKEKEDIKISILEAENLALLESQKVQDRTIVENDMRMMDLECALEDLVTSINPTTKINLMEVFSMFGRSATYFNQLKQMIEMENYDSKEEMERILNKYKSGRNPRITQEEYDQLFDLLYPPVYDIPTAIPEV